MEKKAVPQTLLQMMSSSFELDGILQSNPEYQAMFKNAREYRAMFPQSDFSHKPTLVFPTKPQQVAAHVEEDDDEESLDSMLNEAFDRDCAVVLRLGNAKPILHQAVASPKEEAEPVKFSPTASIAIPPRRCNTKRVNIKKMSRS